jgi:hypothetical protein
MITDRLNALELKYQNLEEMMTLVDTYSRHMSSQIIAILGLAIAILGTAGYFLIRNMVNKAMNKEVDKRLLELIKNNPPVFTDSGYGVPDEHNKIYLSSSIPGIEQLKPDQVLIFEVKAEKNTYSTLETGLLSVLRINDNGRVEIEILNYHENNGNVFWKILWPRINYTVNEE